MRGIPYRAPIEEELLPACSNSSRESNCHDSPGRVLTLLNQIANAQPLRPKKRFPRLCRSRRYMFRLLPSGLPFTLLCDVTSHPFDRCFPLGKNPWTWPIFLACNGLAPLHLMFKLCLSQTRWLFPICKRGVSLLCNLNISTASS